MRSGQQTSMSKALTQNTVDEDEDEAAGGGLTALPAGTRNYITPGGHARLVAELEHLVRVDRPQVVAVVQWAASNGDRSENADYQSLLQNSPARVAAPRHSPSGGDLLSR